MSGVLCNYCKGIGSPIEGIDVCPDCGATYKADMKYIEVIDVIRAEGAPLDHMEIAQRAGVAAHQVCSCLSSMERAGLVVCLRKSDRGRSPSKPGLWNVTEEGQRFGT